MFTHTRVIGAVIFTVLVPVVVLRATLYIHTADGRCEHQKGISASTTSIRSSKSLTLCIHLFAARDKREVPQPMTSRVPIRRPVHKQHCVV